MSLSRRGNNREPLSIWPGFVDAFTVLLLLMMFVLTIFLVVQFVLRDTITTQDTELDNLAEQIASLADTLGLERTKTTQLQGEVAQLGSDLAGARQQGEAQLALIATLNAQVNNQETALAAREAKITSFEAQVATLLAERDASRGEGARLTVALADLEAARTELVSEQEALNLALAKARTEIDAQAETARLAAARREAIDALLKDLRTRVVDRDVSLAAALARLEAESGEKASLTGQITALQSDLSEAEKARLAAAAAAAALQTDLSEAEKARLAEAVAAATLREKLAGKDAALSEAEQTRLAEVAAAEALRAKLKNSSDELTAMTLALEEQRQRAEDTLTLLAGAEAARKDIDLRLAAALLAEAAAKAAAAGLTDAAAATTADLQAQLAVALAAKLAAEQQTGATMTEAEVRAALLATANARLSEETAKSAEAARKLALLNEQITELRTQLGSLQAVLDDAASRDSTAKVQIEALGSKLNSALATVAAEQRRRADLEEAERKRLESQAKNLESYRSEFFGRLRELLAGRQGVRVVGDRFVFSSEVLFQPGSADLAAEGRVQIAGVVQTLQEIAVQIPPEIDWMIRVDGHTDNVPQVGGKYANNWELSQGRALSVVLYMINDLGFPPDRVAATGFGEFRPVAAGDSPQARAQNRRIELKLTER